MSGTTWPAVVAKLVTDMAARVDADVFVHRGPQPQWTKGKTLVFWIGRPALNRHVTTGQDFSKRKTEVYTIRCWAYSWATKGDGTTYEDRAADVEGLIDAVDAYLDEDRTLGGLVTRALVGPTDQSTPSNLDDDPGVDTIFSVQVEATI